MKRREFIKSAAAMGATAALSVPSLASAQQTEPPHAASTEEKLYPLGPDSKPQPGVPAGSHFSFSLDDSRFYPGTTRTIDVYVPSAIHGR